MLGKIAWKNIIYKPLNTILCISLLLFSVGAISLLLSIQHQLEEKFERDLRDIDLVVGAKGSPLQLVLSSVYHLDAPTGNIKLAEAQKIMNHPMVEEAIPLAYGDSHLGFRILGTTEDYFKKYKAQLDEGRVFSSSMEAVVGADVAGKTDLQLNDTFLGTHGEVEGGHVHESHPYTVVGVLRKTNSVLDRLILTNVESVWLVHADGHSHEHALDTLHTTQLDFDHDHDHHDHDGHDHSEHVITPDSMEITAVLLKCKTKVSVLTIPRIVNEQTNMLAALPALEINQLFYMLGVGATTVKFIAGGVMLMACLSMFLVLYNRLLDRKYELALMRSAGYRPWHLFVLLVLEGLLLALLGYLMGWLLSRVGIYVINLQSESGFNIQFSWGWVPAEGWLLLLTFLVGIVAALLPAWKAMKMDVSAILSES